MDGAFRRDELRLLQDAYEASAAEAPHDPEVPRLLGQALLRAGNVTESVPPLERVVELQPRHAASHHDLGLAYLRSDRPDRAAGAFQLAHELDPADPRMLLNLARAKIDLGEFDAARTACLGVLESDGEGRRLANVAHCLLGRIAEHEGERDESEAAYRRALALAPTMPAAHAGLARLGRVADPESIATILRTDEFARGDECTLRFALAQAYDRAGDFERAFAESVRANELQPSTFDPARLERTVDDVIANASAEALDAPGGVCGRRVVFLVGLPRSGTSLLEQMLAEHPEVHAVGEHRELRRIACEIADTYGGVGASLRALDARRAVQLGQRYLATLPAPLTAARVVDKTPGNLFRLGVAARLLPGARVIVCNRDPRDATLSSWFQHFALGAQGHAYDLAHLAAHARCAARLVEHWRDTLPLAIHEISYEALVEDPEPVLRGIFSFLDLSWSPGCLGFHVSRRAVLTASASQVREPVHTRSVGKWRHYERFLGPILDLGVSSRSTFVPM